MERNLMQLNIQRAQEEIDRKKELVSKCTIRITLIEKMILSPETDQSVRIIHPSCLRHKMILLSHASFADKLFFSVSVILMVHFGTVCNGDMRSVKIWFTGNIFPWLLLQVSHMMIILRADAFPEAPLSVKISCS